MGIRASAPALASLDALPARTPQLGKAATPAQARQAAENFEALYVAQMLKPMFEGLSCEPPFGGGLAEDFWRSLQLEEYGKAIVRGGGIGLADAVMRELLAAQEHQSGG